MPTYVCAALGGALFAAIQCPAVAAQTGSTVPIRSLTTIASTDSGIVASISALRPLSGGRTLVVDILRRRVLQFDSTMRQAVVLADTTAGAKNQFGTGLGGLLPFSGDSNFIVDRSSQTLILIEPSGTFGRVIAPPKLADLPYLTIGANGTPGFDPRGRLIYRGGIIFPRITPPSGSTSLVVFADSAPIIRADLDARRLDTIALVRIPQSKMRIVESESDRSQTTIVNPLPISDEWALMADGTVAIVRGLDYHVDWIAPDGTRRTTAKLPFDWRRVTDEEKHRLVDSLNGAIELRASKAPPVPAAPPGSRFLAATSRTESVPANEIPDYYPPIRSGHVRAHPDGTLWILPLTSASAVGGQLWDVVNRDGVLVERVQLPPGRSLVGLGKGDVVYTIVVAQMRVERARITRGQR